MAQKKLKMQVHVHSPSDYKAAAEVDHSMGLTLNSLLGIYERHSLDLYGSALVRVPDNTTVSNVDVSDYLAYHFSYLN